MHQHILTAALAVALLLTIAGCGADPDKAGTAGRGDVAGAYVADQDGHVTGTQEKDSEPLTRAGETIKDGAKDVAKDTKDAAKDAKNAIEDAAKNTGEAVKDGVDHVKKAAEDAKDDLTGKNESHASTGGQDGLNPTGNTANGGVTPNSNPS